MFIYLAGEAGEFCLVLEPSLLALPVRVFPFLHLPLPLSFPFDMSMSPSPDQEHGGVGSRTEEAFHLVGERTERTFSRQLALDPVDPQSDFRAQWYRRVELAHQYEESIAENRERHLVPRPGGSFDSHGTKGGKNACGFADRDVANDGVAYSGIGLMKQSDFSSDRELGKGCDLGGCRLWYSTL